MQNLANIQHKIFTEEILGNMRKAIPRPIQPTHTVDPLGASKGASKSEGRNMTFRPYSFQLRTILHCTGWTVKQINFTTGSRSLNGEVLQEKLKTIKISQKDTERIQSKLTLKVVHELANSQDRAPFCMHTRERGTHTLKHERTPSLTQKCY